MSDTNHCIGAGQRICLCPGGIGGGGIGVVMLNLAEELLARNVKVDLLIAARDGVARNVPAGVNVIDLGPRVRTALGRAVSYLSQARPDVVISARSYVNLLMLAAHRLAPGRANRRLIWSYHTHRSAEMARARPALRLIDGLALRLAAWPEARVAVSVGVAADLRVALGQKAAQAPITVIPNPGWTLTRAAQVFAACPHPWLADRAPRLLRGGALSPEPVLIGMGRFAPQKDFPTLLRAFAELRHDHPAVRLILLGDGPDRAALTKLCAELELRLDQDIALPGHVDQPMAWLSRADIFVHSALWEGLPMALVEALGAGLPIVATNCPSGPDEILDHGRFGWLVPPDNSAALSRAMAEALVRVIDPVAQAVAAERFSASLAATRYLHLGFSKP